MDYLPADVAINIPSPATELNVRLRALLSADRKRIYAWLADPYLVQLTFVVPSPEGLPIIPFTNETAQKYVDILVFDLTRRSFAVEVNGVHVGNVGLKQYDPAVKTAECFIEIGASEFRGRGVGTASMCMLLDYGFHQLGLQEIRLEVLEFNHIARRVYDRLGFVPGGVTGWHYDSRKHYWRVLGMRISHEKWEAQRNKIELAADINIIN